MPSSSSQTVGTREAARRLGITQQAVRDRLRAGTLSGHQEGGEWRVGTAQLPVRAAPAPPTTTLAGIERRLADIEQRMSSMAAEQHAAAGAADAIARERDRYRADAASAREAALRLAGGTRDAVAAARQLLDALDAHADAIAQLVGPSSPQDLLP